MSKQTDDFPKFKTYEEYAEFKAPQESLLPILTYSGDDPELISIREQKQVEHIISCVNGDWIANLKDDSQWKYRPWFEITSSGLRFDVYVIGRSNTNVGARLCTKDAERCKFVGKTFIKKYNSFMVVNI